MSGTVGSSLRFRALTFLQAALIVGSLFAPMASLGADPTASPDPTPSATAPDTTPDPTPDPTATPDVTPAPAPTDPAPTDPSPTDPAPTDPAPTPDPTVDPTIAPTPAPAADPGLSAAYIITFAAGTSADIQSAILVAAGATSDQAIPQLRMHAVALTDAGIAALSNDPAVIRIDSDLLRAAEAAPGDPGYPTQWALSKIGWDLAFGSVTPTGSAVVALLDTGVDASHPDLAGTLVGGTSVLDGSAGTSDPNGHGTALAGIIVAATDNGIGIAGVGYAGVRVMPVTVLGADGTGQDSDIITGVLWAADHGADVINMSFSNPGYSLSLQAAIDYAWSRGAVIVAATGNDGSSTVSYPAGDRGVIGVSNTDSNDALNPSSNYGTDVFLAAPGTNISATDVGGGYSMITGTSASSAIVAAAAALMHAQDPSLSNGVIVNRLAITADAAGTVSETGNGRVNLARALSETSTDSVQPAGAAPFGLGGPIVGPYVAAGVSTTTIVTPTGFSTISVAPGGTVSVPYAFTYATTGSGATTATSGVTTSATYNVYMRLGGTDYLIAGPVTQTGLTNGTHSVGSAAAPLTASVTFNGLGSNPPGAGGEDFNLRIDVTKNNGSNPGSNAANSSGTWVSVTAASGSVASVAVGTQTGTRTYGAVTGNVAYAVDATRGANGNFTGNYSVSGLPAGVTGSFSPTAGDATGSAALVDSTLTLTVTNLVPAGSYTFTVTLGGVNSPATGVDSGVLVVAKAAATFTVTPYSVTYDGLAHSASVSTVTGVNGETGATVGTVNVSNTTHTNAGTYASDSWSFTGTANYNNQGPTTISDSIGKAAADCTSIVGFTGPYDTFAHGASGTCEGVGTDGALAGLALGATFTNVPGGTAYWVFTDASGNYNDTLGNVAIVINQVASVTTVTCPAGTYTYSGSAQTPCSATVTGVGLSLTPTPAYSDNTNAGLATASYTFAGDTNYTGSNGSDTFTIDQADADCTITGYDVTYDAAGHTATGSCLGVEGETLVGLVLSGTTHTAAGSYPTDPWTFTDVIGNYTDDSGTVADNIDQAPSIVTITCPVSATYTGIALTPCTASYSGAGGLSGSLTPSYSNNIVVGTAGVSASYGGDANHLASSNSTTFEITKASSGVTISCPTNVTYTGSALTPCTASYSGAGGLSGSLTPSYLNNTNAGGATVTASYPGDVNHNGSAGSAGFTIDKATSTTVVTCPASALFTGPAFTPCTATVTGAGSLSASVTVTYLNNTFPGTASATATYAGDLNHFGSTDTKTFTIIGYTLFGFYQPVDMNHLNIVKGGSTVPLKFEMFAGSNELTSTSYVKGFKAGVVNCDFVGDLPSDLIEMTTTGGTSLRYDSTGGQFIQNWQTPKQPGLCYAVTMTALDNSHITAVFKLK